MVSRGKVFELSGGRLCLDFANTVDNRPTEERRDLLEDYRNLVSWAEQAGAIDGGQARALLRASRARGPASRKALARAKELREAIYETFSAIALGREPDEDALSHLRAALPRAYRSPTLLSHPEGYELSWQEERGAFDAMLWPVVRSAVDLLTSAELDRVRLCAAETCAWLFLDESRNRSRQWCDMSVCGNRAKARRFYEKSRKLRRRGRRASVRSGGSSSPP